MTTTAAQDEFNELLRDKDIDHRHPEDRDDDSDHSEPESTDHDDDYREIIDTDDELEIPVEMRVNYQVPSTRYEANTGPKGVIADAQAFQEAMKLELISKTSHSKPALWKDESTISDEDTEKFLKSWREKRVQELQNMKQRIRSRTISPGRRIYGSIPIVDGPQCLHAIQHTPPTTLLIVVLCLHDYLDRESDHKTYASEKERVKDMEERDTRAQKAEEIEDTLYEVAQRNETVRFIKIYEEDHSTPNQSWDSFPLLNAYTAGTFINSVVPLHELDKGSNVTALSLETLLRQKQIF